MIPLSIKESIEKQFLNELNKPLKISENFLTGGGCINSTAVFKSNEGDFFVKWNDAKRYPDMFETEMKGLNLLSRAGVIRVPNPIFTGQADGKVFLLMECIESGTRHNSFWEDFGRALALLHKNSSPFFGLDHNNYIGSLNQYNEACLTWTDFFITQRLEIQIALAVDCKLMHTGLLNSFNKLFKRLSEIFPDEQPALLHGDLWNGNFMTAKKGEACIIDPAVYYGHREMDLGMSKLFGGFSLEFYEAYKQSFPLEKGWEGRIEICNLYPLLVHLNLFGRAYLGEIERVVKRF